MRRRAFHTLVFWLALVVTAGCGSPVADTDPVPAAELLARLEAGTAPLILDVRTPEEFAAGHIPGAVNLPHTSLSERLGELGDDPDREIVVHCKSGRRAALAQAALGQAGFTRIRHLDGDMDGWLAAGLPVTAGAAP
jgi:rhodanese-related sulfurtransferase